MDLLTNAIESIQVGVEDYRAGTRPRLLSAVRNIHAGILLLYKEKLRRQSPEKSNNVLMMAKIVPSSRDENGKVVFVGDGKKTADTNQIKERCDALGIHTDWKRFDRINDARNEVEHLYPRLDQKGIAGLISDSLIIIRDFVVEQLRHDPLTLLGESTWRSMLEVSEVYEAQRSQCAELAAKAKWSSAMVKRGIEQMACRNCGASLWKPFEEAGQTSIECCSCGATFEHKMYRLEAIVIALGLEEMEATAKGSERIYRQCPSCDSMAFVVAERRCAMCEYTTGTTCAACGKNIDGQGDEVSTLCTECAGPLS
jgi:hypothetical protein